MVANVKIQIDKDFEARCRKLTDEEYRQLEENIVAAERIREKLILWHGKLVDGHQRYQVHRDHGVPFEVEELDPKLKKADVLEWISRNQLGRRNLRPTEARYHRGLLLSAAEKRQGKKKKEAELTSGQITPKSKREVAKELAEKDGVHPDTVRGDERFAKTVDQLAPVIKQQLLSGELKATDREVTELAKLTVPNQLQSVRAVRSGQYKSVGDAVGLKRSDWSKRGPKKKKKAAGKGQQKTVDDADLEGHFRALTRLLDERATIRGGQGPHHRACQQALTEAYAAWTAWKKCKPTKCDVCNKTGR